MISQRQVLDYGRPVIGTLMRRCMYFPRLCYVKSIRTIYLFHCMYVCRYVSMYVSPILPLFDEYVKNMDHEVNTLQGKFHSICWSRIAKFAWQQTNDDSCSRRKLGVPQTFRKLMHGIRTFREFPSISLS